MNCSAQHSAAATQPADASPYQQVDEYLTDYLALLSLQLHREVLLLRAVRGTDRQESFLGLFISDTDISAILQELHGQLRSDFGDNADLNARISSQHSYINRRLALTDIALPLQQLAAAFALQSHEQQLLLLALAPQLDSRFGRVYGFLHDDISRQRLSAGLAQQLLGIKDVSARALRRSLHSDSALLKYRLLLLNDDDNQPLLARSLQTDTRLVNFLLGMQQPDDELTTLMLPPWAGDVTLQQDACSLSAQQCLQQWRQTPCALLLQLNGDSDADLWLSLFCGQQSLSLLCLPWARLTKLDYQHAARLLRKAIREAHLSGSLLHLQAVDNRHPGLLSLLWSLLTPLCCLSTEQALPTGVVCGPLLHLTVPSPSLANRQACWQAMLPDTLDISPQVLRRCAGNYRLPVTAIADVLHQLNSQLPGNTTPAIALQRACRTAVAQSMAQVAQRVDSDFSFTDLVLPGATRQALQQLVQRQAHTDTVLTDWGLGSLLHQQKGCAALFIGASGTGKTMAAGVLANELGLDLYRVDLSAVVSKYIGETEKNLERIFTVAAQSQVVLFIDEADALFGKRTEVQDAHDRYANIEVSYLLQKMEQHPGVVILASNFSQNIDDAFFRRFSTVVEFTLPAGTERLQLWQKLHHSKVPLSAELDLPFLAERFELAGGHIKNCLLSAAYQAAAQQKPLDMLMLIRAIGQEYTKLGKPVSKQSFGDYYAALRRSAAE
jgi:hypothetical protein